MLGDHRGEFKEAVRVFLSQRGTAFLTVDAPPILVHGGVR